jgi:hypothetical protein
MRFIIASLAVLSVACTISPVVTDPGSHSDRYSDCQQAARGYCRYVADAAPSETDKCTAEATYKCVVGNQ